MSADYEDELGLEQLLQRSEAARLLDELERGGALPAGRAAAARAHYSRLQRAAAQALADGSALQARAAQLVSQLARVQGQADVVAAAAAGGFSDAVQVLDKFREDSQAAASEAALSQDMQEGAERQAEALQRRLAELACKLGELEEERRAELAPDLRAARDDLNAIRAQLEAEHARAAAEREQAADAAARLAALQAEVGSLQGVAEEERDAAAKAELLPVRARHGADMALAAVRQLKEEDSDLGGRLAEQEAAETAAGRDAREVGAAQAAAARAGDKLRAAMAKQERAAEEAQRDIELAQVEAEKLVAERVTLSLEVERKGAAARRAADLVKSEQRGRDLALRRLNRAELQVSQLQEQLPPLEAALQSLRGQQAALARQGVCQEEASQKLQAEVEAAVARVAGEKNLTELQAELVRASMADARGVEEECAAARGMVAARDRLAGELSSQRDAASRLANQRLQRLQELLDDAEARDGEAEQLRQRQGELKAQGRELQQLCALMAGQQGQQEAVLQQARRSAAELGEQVQGTETHLGQLKTATESRGRELKAAERRRASAAAQRAQAASELAAVRRQAAAVVEEADAVAVEHALLQRAADEGRAAAARLRHAAAAAAAAKQATQTSLLERDEEMCVQYERCAAMEAALSAGTLALQKCGDEARGLQLELGELQRRMFATQKTAPDVAAYDRQVAALKADVLRARREAEGLGTALESPGGGAQRWRLLGGKLPGRGDLEGRVAGLEERLTQRCGQAVQKAAVLSELEALAEGLLERARTSNGGAFDLSLRLNDTQRGLQAVTRRLMAAVSELSLYQALAMKYAADREGLSAALAAAYQNAAEGRPPTSGADKEFERQERDRWQQEEVRQQARELRRLREAGLLGVPQSHATPRPQAYLPDDGGVVLRPFLAPFAPFKPTGEPLPAATLAQRRLESPAPSSTGCTPAAGSASPVPPLHGLAL